MAQSDDIRWMSYALSLGARGQGCVWPNPAVGCVLVRDGRVIGRGWTSPGGRPHAETVALAQAGDAAGATAYVTLEPCAHEGQTPPCTRALINAKLARVVVAVRDPDPRVSGKGLAQLEAAGIAVQTGVLEEAARAAHQGFFSRIMQHRPLVTVKLASSLDGRIATQSGDSQWITGPQARRAVHAMRARSRPPPRRHHGARADLPSLTVRGFGKWNAPLRIVTSAALDLPKTGPLAQTARQIPVWLIHGPAAPAEATAFWRSCGAQLFEVPLEAGGLDLAQVLAVMAGQGLTRVFCEGGGQLAGALLRAGFVDRLVCFTGGVAIGGDGRASLSQLGLKALSEAPRFELSETRIIGDDIMSIWKPQPGPAQTP